MNPNAPNFVPAAGGAGRSAANIQKAFREKLASVTKKAEEDKRLEEAKFEALPMLPNDGFDREMALNANGIMNSYDMKLISSMIITQAKDIYKADKESGKLKKNFVFVISSHGTSTRDIGYNSHIVLTKERGVQEIVAYGAHKSTLVCDLGIQTKLCQLWTENKELELRNGVPDKRERYLNHTHEVFPYDYILQSTEDKSGRFLKTGVVMCNLPRNTIILSFDDLTKSILLSQVYGLIELFVETYCEGVWDGIIVKTHLLFCRASAVETGDRKVNIVELEKKHLKGGARVRKTYRKIKLRRTRRQK